ncbi:uncharacterized protein isoform X2 [Choristoneura fumiferana]|uniref:uncharacterized protein isoform X2 n=1 Tax=Choristoneura fumiferana TaxID=7141 RepID=UPI003D15ADAA
MSSMFNFIKTFSARIAFRGFPKTKQCHNLVVRNCADKPKTDKASKAAVQGTQNEERLRVRRARPSDVPRVLRFVRENARVWPGPHVPTASPLVLGDYVARALAQGHSMVAEQHENRRGWNQIRGLALGTAVCPWDAAMLERWARCIRCTRSRRLMHFTAHCLRAPALHDKYRVHNILQVILIVPPDIPKSGEIINVLAKNSIERGRDVGFPLLRFDVTSESIAKALEDLNLRKEWQLSYDIVPEEINDVEGSERSKQNANRPTNIHGNFIAVYTAFTRSGG